jgi:hypothetical protein
VAEVVRVTAAGEQDLPPPELVEVGRRLFLAVRVHPGEDVDGHRRSGRGRDPGQVTGAGRELQQPGLQHGLDPRGEHGWRAAAVPAGPQRLHHEQRVAVGLGVQPVGIRLAQLVTEPAGQRGGLGAVQPAQAQF